MQASQQAVRAHNDRALRKLVIVLVDSLQVIPRRVGLTNGTRSEIHDFVSVAANVSI